MSELFRYTDSDGDRLTVEPERAEPGAVVYVGAVTADGIRAGVFMGVSAVDRLRAALAPYGSNREAAPERGNPAAILDYVDPEGDALTVYTRTNPAEPLALTLTCGAGNGELTVTLMPEAVTRLREALKPHDPAEKDAEAPAPAIVVGREYRLLPGAFCRLHGGGTVPTFEGFRGVTRVRVVHGPDSIGDFWVTPLDGEAREDHATAPQFLAPLTEAAPDPAPQLDPVREAALKLARELAPTAVPGDLLVLAAFLTGGLGGVTELAQASVAAGGAA
ncbi:hypothetical protein ACFWDN_21100 [Micromonospora chalcea]